METELNEYIGSNTMYSCADKGAFGGSGDVRKELIDYANTNESVIAIVDESGVEFFLSILKSGNCNGRDVEKFIKAVEENYMGGFMMCK